MAPLHASLATIRDNLAAGSSRDHYLARLAATHELRVTLSQRVSEVPPAALLPLLPELTELLRAQLLDGRAPIVLASCGVVQAVVVQCESDAASLVRPLLPILLDRAAGSGQVGFVAHLCVRAALLRLSLHEAVPQLLCAPSSATGSPTSGAQARLCEQLHLLLAAPPPRCPMLRRRAPLLAKALVRLMQEAGPCAACPAARAHARHAYLCLLEQWPAAVQHELAALPPPLRKALQAAAAMRARPLGPPLLPPPPPSPRHLAALRLQAAARGRVTRRCAAAARGWLGALRLGKRVEAAGQPGALRYRGGFQGTEGEWFGVALDVPAGRHDGEVRGVRLFESGPARGVLVRGAQLAPEGGWPRAARLPPRPPQARTAAGTTTNGTAAPPAAACAPAADSADIPPPAPPPPAPALSVLLASHEAVLRNMKQLCDGQLAVIKGHKMAANLSGDANKQTYLKQMGLLAQQQRLLACQLHDTLQGLASR